MPKLTRISSLVSVANVKKSSSFFNETLGFNVIYSDDFYAEVERDGITIKLQKSEKDIAQQACYIDVTGVDGLYLELKGQLDKLPEGRVREPFNQAYGMREFHVIDLDQLLIFFGEAIKS